MIKMLLMTAATGFVVHQVSDIDVKKVAEEAIASSYRQHAPEAGDPHAGLSDAERASLGRYLEAPSIGDVYPGVGEALKNR